MRLIDGDSVWEAIKSDVSPFTVAMIARHIHNAPTIDPETLPIVRQLREELARVTAERDALKMNPPVEIQADAFALAVKLAKVAADRDAAVKDRAELADYELATCEQFCFGDREHNFAPCAWLIDGMCKLRGWRGPQKGE